MHSVNIYTHPNIPAVEPMTSTHTHTHLNSEHFNPCNSQHEQSNIKFQHIPHTICIPRMLYTVASHKQSIFSSGQFTAITP